MSHTKIFSSKNILCATILAAFVVSASAQTTTKPATTTKSSSTTRSRTAASSSALPKGIPPVHGIVRTAYTLKYEDIVIGKGELATPMKMYTINYTGYLRSTGKVFDSSIPDKENPKRKPFTFPSGVHRVIIGFDTDFAGMRVGGKRRFFIPYQLAYGDTGSPLIPGKPQAIPPKSDLVFDVELLGIADLPKPPAPRPRPLGSPSSAVPHSGAPGTPMARPAAPASAPVPPAAPKTTTPAAPNSAKPATTTNPQ